MASKRATAKDGEQAIVTLAQERKTKTTATPADSRHCIGAVRYGIDPHEAPTAAFGKHTGSPDGLSRMCREDWKLYTKALAASKAAATEGTTTTVVTEAAPAAPRLATPEQVEKATRVRTAKSTLAAIDALPGPEAVVAIGTDEAQEALAIAADASLGSRVEEVDAD